MQPFQIECGGFVKGVTKLQITRFRLTSLSNKRNLEGTIFGWLVVWSVVRRDFQTRTNMSLDCLWTVSDRSLNCL